MNKLTNAQRAQIIALLCEGNSIRATVRLTGASKNTVAKLICDLGEACSAYQDKTFRKLTCKRLQCDEIWAFVGCKDKNATDAQKAKGQGSVWTWTALDADTKLIPCWYVGTRDGGAAYHFMHDLAGRLAHRVQLTTDGHRPYLTAVEDAFGKDIDYAMLNKIYGNSEQGPETRYSPAQCMGAKKAVITGKPDFNHVSTSFAERQNLNLRMQNRRFTRLTNAFSKKVENHEHAVAISMMHHNFCRIHQTLRVTPAMQAGLTDHVWEISEVIALLEKTEEKAA
jgi:IS1 family transposase